MAITKASVVAIAPELAAVSDEDFAIVIGDVGLQLSPDAWDTLLDLGTKYLTAHTLAVAHPELYRPMIQSDKAGAVETHYLAPAQGGDELDATKYGKEFKRLRRQLGLQWLLL